MKLKNIWIAFAVALTACAPKAETSLEKLTHERDSLKTIYTDLRGQIQTLELEIAEHDSNIVYTAVTEHLVQSGTFNHYFEIQGNLEADQNVLIFPESMGNVTRILVEKGDYVSKGVSIMKLNTDVLNAQIEQLEANLELAKTMFEKQERLWAKKIGSEVQYLQAKTQKESLTAQLDALKEQKSMSTVTAPFSGYIDDVFLNPGDMATMQQPAARIVNLNKVYLNADVSERYLGKVKKGDVVEVIFPNIDTTSTKINRIGNFVNPANRSFLISMDLNNTNGMLKPNMLADIKINDYSNDSVSFIPSSLVMQDPQGNDFTFRLKNSGNHVFAEKVILTAGKSYEGQTEILAGLNGGDVIIDMGARSVIDGQEVTVSQQN